MREEILKEISDIEQVENVKILLACESGSRAWGFESTDSDYDVRFKYLRPRDWYLTIYPGRDVIERPIDDQLDVSGWDLKKALALFRKSNPPLYEWLRSPIIYKEEFSVTQQLRDLSEEFFSPVGCMYHYFHMAQGNYREYLKGEEVWIKKYFYLLRPIMACMWIERDLGPIPMEFDVMVEKLITDGDLKQAVAELTERKKQGQELGRGPRIPIISAFIEAEMKRLEATTFEVKKGKGHTETLNQLFLDALDEVWGARG